MMKLEEAIDFISRPLFIENESQCQSLKVKFLHDDPGCCLGNAPDHRARARRKACLIWWSITAFFKPQQTNHSHAPIRPTAVHFCFFNKSPIFTGFPPWRLLSSAASMKANISMVSSGPPGATPV